MIKLTDEMLENYPSVKRAIEIELGKRMFDEINSSKTRDEIETFIDNGELLYQFELELLLNGSGNNSNTEPIKGILKSPLNK